MTSASVLAEIGDSGPCVARCWPARGEVSTIQIESEASPTSRRSALSQAHDGDVLVDIVLARWSTEPGSRPTYSSSASGWSRCSGPPGGRAAARGSGGHQDGFTTRHQTIVAKTKAVCHLKDLSSQRPSSCGNRFRHMRRDEQLTSCARLRTSPLAVGRRPLHGQRPAIGRPSRARPSDPPTSLGGCSNSKRHPHRLLDDHEISC